jgi:hypothetical protein
VLPIARPRPLAAPARRRALAAAACTALVLSVAPLGAAAAQAAPATAVVAAHGPSVLHVEPSRKHLKGTDHRLDYDVAIPVFSGAGAAAVNRRVAASARSTIAAAAKDRSAHHTLGGVGRVTTNDGRTVQVVIEYADYFDGAAHPTDTVSTVALVAGTGAPITLSEVFPRKTAAFRALAAEVKRIAAAAGEPVTEPDGLAPRTANWAAWQSKRSGFVVHFQDYQLGGHGLRSYTVPWKVVTPLLSAKAKRLLAPRG